MPARRGGARPPASPTIPSIPPAPSGGFPDWISPGSSAPGEPERRRPSRAESVHDRKRSVSPSPQGAVQESVLPLPPGPGCQRQPFRMAATAGQLGHGRSALLPHTRHAATPLLRARHILRSVGERPRPNGNRRIAQKGHPMVRSRRSLFGRTLILSSLFLALVVLLGIIGFGQAASAQDRGREGRGRLCLSLIHI